jgi:signal transduction histidine kinase
MKSNFLNALSECVRIDAGIPAVQMAIATFLVVSALAFWSRTQISLPGRRWFTYSSLAMLWWLAAVGIELSVSTLPCTLSWAQVAWVGIIFLPTFWCFFLYEYAFSKKVPPGLVWIGAAFLPSAFLALVMTNTFHGQLYGAGTRLIDDGIKSYTFFDHGRLFFVLISYLYLIIVGTCVVAGGALLKASPAVRSFFVKLFLTTIIPVTANILYVFYGFTLFGTDPTPFSFAASLTLVVWLIVNGMWVDVRAISRDLLFYTSPDLVFVIKVDGNLLETNLAAKAFLRSQQSDGRSLSTLKSLGPVFASLTETAELPDILEVQNGDQHYVARAYPISWGEGQTLLGWTVAFVDVTVQKRDAARALAAERVQAQFLATVSHELRTPLTVVKGALGLLKINPSKLTAEKTDHLVSLALKNSTILAALVNDLLDMQKLESSEFSLNLEIYDVCDIISGAVASMETFNHKGNVKLRFDERPGEVMIWADNIRMHQVVVNVISNAIKFSRQNSVVEVCMNTVGDTVQITVKDTGRGIPAGSEEKVFGRFLQVDGSDEKDVYGSGLGMHISRQILSQHGGTIGYVSEFGVGTLFTITLPINAILSDTTLTLA